jgi:hydrogenase expression/formation protein HypE
MHDTFPVGKLPADLLARLLSQVPVQDPRVLVGPGIGMDCAVVDHGDTLLVYKSDPVTFATDQIGLYTVQVNANDIATTGAVPKWLLMTLLLPEAGTTSTLVEGIFGQIHAACRQMNVALIGGHTEITHDLNRPIAVGAMVGEVEKDRLITPRGAQPGDRILLTKGVPIETTAILAREFPERLRHALSPLELKQAAHFLTEPGISVLRDARIALSAGKVSAMHDPTEGGLTTALWELAQASGRSLRVDLTAVPIPDLSACVCRVFDIDPLASIASGALLLTVAPEDSHMVRQALDHAGIACADIGLVETGPAIVVHQTPTGWQRVPLPQRDAIARAYESEGSTD